MLRSATRLGAGRALGLGVGITGAALIAASAAEVPGPQGCAPRPACNGLACSAACPRDAVRDAAGRCACVDGDLPLLGACVPPAVGDAFCGASERMGPEGCTFRACDKGELLDLLSGACIARAAAPGGGAVACGEHAARALAGGRTSCLTLDATCPRGTRYDAGACDRMPRCPPGTLPDLEGKDPRGGCQVVVTAGGRTTGQRVDVGAWATRVLGVDGGWGSPDLCRPLARRAAALGLGPGEASRLEIGIELRIPDQDVSRVQARVTALDAGPTGEAGAPPRAYANATAGQAAVEGALDTLVEAFRGLGGEASTGAVDLRVRCLLTGP